MIRVAKIGPGARRRAHGSMAELPVALYCFLLVIVFPLIDLLGVATGATIVYLSTNEAATRAANQRHYSDSLNGMLQTAQAFTQTGFASFAKMQAIGGYESSGADLYIDANNTKSGSTQSYGPNTDITAPIDQSTYVYEARVNSSYEVGPLINLGFLPIISSVEGLGKPAIINFSAAKQIEYPGGLAVATPPTNGTLTAFSTTPSPNEATADGGVYQSGWNMPDIYSQIASAGQTVLDSTVVQVLATNPYNTPTTINVAAGNKLWIDLRSNGQWGTGGGVNGQNTANQPVWDANGMPPAQWPYFWVPANMTTADLPSPQANPMALLGQVGSNPYFVVGTTYQNYAPNQIGLLGLIDNDGYYWSAGNGIWSTVFGSGYGDNFGMQTVRVILTD